MPAKWLPARSMTSAVTGAGYWVFAARANSGLSTHRPFVLLKVTDAGTEAPPATVGVNVKVVVVTFCTGSLKAVVTLAVRLTPMAPSLEGTRPVHVGAVVSAGAAVVVKVQLYGFGDRALFARSRMPVGP